MIGSTWYIVGRWRDDVGDKRNLPSGGNIDLFYLPHLLVILGRYCEVFAYLRTFCLRYVRSNTVRLIGRWGPELYWSKLVFFPWKGKKSITEMVSRKQPKKNKFDPNWDISINVRWLWGLGGGVAKTFYTTDVYNCPNTSTKHESIGIRVDHPASTKRCLFSISGKIDPMTPSQVVRPEHIRGYHFVTFTQSKIPGA